MTPMGPPVPRHNHEDHEGPDYMQDLLSGIHYWFERMATVLGQYYNRLKTDYYYRIDLKHGMLHIDDSLMNGIE